MAILLLAVIFSSAGGQVANLIAQWNGTSWQGLGTGIVSANPAYYQAPYVSSLMLYNGNLIAAGNFQIAGGITSNNIALWNGSTWKSMGGGTDLGYAGEHTVNALAVYNGNLIVGGQFQTIGGASVPFLAQWNGSVWSSLGGRCNSQVSGFTVYNGNLIVQGAFDTIGGIPANRIAEWNGSSWSPLSVSFFYSNPQVYNGSLYFNYSNDSTIGKWSGTGNGTPIGTSLDTKERWNSPGAHSIMCPLCVYNGNLIVGGWFTSVNGVSCNNNIAQWNGTSWSGF